MILVIITGIYQCHQKFNGILKGFFIILNIAYYDIQIPLLSCKFEIVTVHYYTLFKLFVIIGVKLGLLCFF